MSNEITRSCYNCKNQSLCYLRRRIYDAMLPGAAWMFDDTEVKPPRPFTDIFDTLAEICNQYQRVEQETER